MHEGHHGILGSVEEEYHHEHTMMKFLVAAAAVWEKPPLSILGVRKL